MTHTTAKITTPTQQSTCETCSKFQDFNESNGRGWCTLFDHQARKHHTLTSDCQQQLESEQLKELLSNYNAFLKPIAKGLPGRNVYKQAPDYGYDRIGYVGHNFVGWFALDRHGFTVIERQPSQLAALSVLVKR